MSRGYAMKGLSRGKGFLEIEPARGVRSLLAGLARGEPRLLVGLDGASPNVRRRTDERPVAARALAAFVVPEPGASPRLGAVAVPDPVGGPGAVDVITVAGLPTTAEGGIDRDALAGSAGRARAAVLPRTELESRIAAVFKRALGVGRVGVGESFFELGGHSLLAVRLVTELRSAVGIDVPLDRIVESPTVAGLARWVEEQTESGAEPAAPLPACIVPVQPRGTRRPFFCVHPASGSPACFAALASYLGEDRPFYGFLSPGLLDDRPVLRRVEELAELYAGAMREVQPDGPYLLGGWSSGGPVAYEMARILERDGQRVALLALIDSGLMQSDAAEYGGGSRGPLALLRGTATLVSFARQLGVPRRYADVRAILQLGGISLPPTPRDAFRGGPRAGLRLARRLNGELVRATRAFRANTYAGLEYQPKPFGGTVTALRTRREGRDPALEDLRAFAARVDHVEVPGNHMTVVLGTDDTRALAERLGACIDAASTNS